MTRRRVGAMLFLLVCFLTVPTLDAYRYSVFVVESQTWTPPAGASNVSVTLWGGGGGASSTPMCGASGGSGAAIINRSTNSHTWDLPVDALEWALVVGAGGAGAPSSSNTDLYGTTAGDGGNTSIIVTAPNGTELFRVTAYGGGGARSTGTNNPSGCQGGGGGGRLSSAFGPAPGNGTPSGGVDANPVGPPAEGAMVGDVKAGGAGAGYGFVDGDLLKPFVRGADWNSVVGSWPGGYGSATSACFAWGGAAGFNGEGGRGQDYVPRYPPANSGSGGGSSLICNPGTGYADKYYDDAAGASGGIIIEYDHPVAPTPSSSPTPSRTPSSTPTRSPTPSITPSPTPQPFSQLVTLVSPISGRQLTPQDDGSVKSLWYGVSYKEKWTVARLSSGKYTFKGFNGRYLGADPGGWVRADATSVGSWEQWDVIINAGNQWTLKSVHGTYMGTTVAGVIYLNSDSTLYWTKSAA
ncbi:Fascin-like incomplete domain containing protein [Pandoravirus macleodensis]|uniref:Fascin-like incomplete domain containing protein n=1 Tax=Pandoravirus macleodensis TaxID=2107707 RepID=A0A2U7UG38_9VIRU|nr:Fascin-like incomplete domain containing protein [Pandoravirus macleodensis]AVK77402.1 Fascin-like incomplete domain containing protein [Pandoravirus macleodensis]